MSTCSANPGTRNHKTKALPILQGLTRSIIVLTENPEAAVKISYFMHPESVPSGILARNRPSRRGRCHQKLRAPLNRAHSAGTDKWCDFPKEAWDRLVDILGPQGKVDASEFYTDELIARSMPSMKTVSRLVRDLKVPDSDADIAAC